MKKQLFLSMMLLMFAVDLSMHCAANDTQTIAKEPFFERYRKTAAKAAAKAAASKIPTEQYFDRYQTIAKFQQRIKPYLSKKVLERKQKEALLKLEKPLKRYQERKYAEFIKFLKSIPYTKFRDLICSGGHIAALFYPFLENKFDQKIFERNPDGTINSDNFTESFTAKVKNPQAWLDEQIQKSMTKFHNLCYQEFELRATSEMVKNNMSWTDAVSIPNGPGQYLYPIQYFCGDKHVIIEKYPPLDCPHLVLGNIFANVMARFFSQEIKQKPIGYQLSIYAGELPSSDGTQDPAYHNFCKIPFDVKIFDQQVSDEVASVFCLLQGERLYEFSDGSLITSDTSHLYYYKFDPEKNLLEEQNRLKYDDILGADFLGTIKELYLSADKKLLHMICVPNTEPRQLKLCTWNFTMKDSAMQSADIVDVENKPWTGIFVDFFAYPGCNLQASAEFVVRALMTAENNMVDIFTKDQKNPAKLTYIQTLEFPNVMHEQRLNFLVVLHEDTNRLAVVCGNSLILYQLLELSAPLKIKTVDFKQTQIKNVAWNKTGGLLAVALHDQTNGNAIQILKSPNLAKLDEILLEGHQSFYMQFSPNDRYFVYGIKVADDLDFTNYLIQDLKLNGPVCCLQILNPWLLSATGSMEQQFKCDVQWNLNDAKNQMYVFNKNKADESNMQSCTIVNFDTIAKTVVPSLTEQALKDYCMSLGHSKKRVVQEPILPMEITEETTQEEIDAYYQTEQAKLDQEYYEQERDFVYETDWPSAAHQVFLLGQFVFEQNSKALEKLGGATWITKQPEDIQKFLKSLQAQKAKSAKAAKSSGAPAAAAPTPTNSKKLAKKG